MNRIRVIVYASCVVIAIIIGGMADTVTNGKQRTVTPNYSPHIPISILGDIDFFNQAATEGWIGSGTSLDPYMICNYEILTPGDFGISISATTVHFAIKDCNISAGTNGIELNEVANGVIFNNTVAGGNAGIYLEMSPNNIIECNEVFGTSMGIMLRIDSNGNQIYNNTVRGGWQHGIYTWDSSDITISNNTVKYSGMDGMCIINTQNVVVENNTLFGNEVDIEIERAENVRLRNNTMNTGISIMGDFSPDYPKYYNTHDIDASNVLLSKPVLYIKNMNGGTVPSGYGQIMLANCTDMKIENQTFSGGYCAILLGFVTESSIRNNSFELTKIAIHTRRSNFNYVAENHIGNCTNGFVVDYSNDNTMDDNFINHCIIGVSSAWSLRNDVLNNTIINNNKGLTYYRMDNGKIMNNTFSHSTSHGLFIQTSINNIISGNQINNNQLGIGLIGSSNNNKIYHNDFSLNTENAEEMWSSVNIWDNGYPSGGNWWADYNGTDIYTGPSQNIAGSDGIGDMPYADINGDTSSQDDYPLVKPVMSINKDAATEVYLNQSIEYWLNYTNFGSATAYNVIIAETYPINTTFISAVPMPDIGNDIWIIGSVQPHATASIQVTVEVNVGASGILVNTATLTYENYQGIACVPAVDAATTKIIGPVHNIDSDEYFYNIQPAIDDVNTLDGHRIEVAPGIYIERVTVNKGLDLIGPAEGEAVVDGGSLGTTMRIISDWVNITRFSITGGNGSELDSGLSLVSADNCRIEDNVIFDDWTGVSLLLSENNSIVNNVVTKNGQSSSCGIFANLSHGNVISGNDILSNDGIGMQIVESFDNIVYENTFMNNTPYGISSDISSHGNLFYHNTFKDNPRHAMDENPGFNQWNAVYPVGGNFWDDYTGNDIFTGPYQNVSGQDGFGDVPYDAICGPLSQDWYPLMNVWVTSKPYRINSNDDFDSSHGVRGGDGSPEDPWAIEMLNINGDGYGYCLYIGNTTDYFVIKSCNLSNASGVDEQPYYSDAGVILFNVTHGMVQKCQFYRNEFTAIDLRQTSNLSIDNCTIVSCDYGVYGEDMKDCRIECNNISSGVSIGAVIIAATNVTLKNNSFGNPMDYAIYFYLVDHSEIIDNNISNCYAGIVFENSVSDKIKGNMIRENEIGIEFYESDGNMIEDNDIITNGYAGVEIYDSWNNTFVHNSFIDNSMQAYDDCNNVWDNGYPSGGNYWDDYNGTDEYSGVGQNVIGPDGLGDSPYTNISGGAGARDNYPLTAPWTPVPEILTTILLPVVPGWNLVSVPVDIVALTLPAQLLDGDTVWDRVMWYDASDAADPWNQYYSGWSWELNDLSRVETSMGFWLNVTDVGDGFLNLTGISRSSTTIDLRAGWNLVGYPSRSDSTYTVAQLKAATGATIVEGFDPGATYMTQALDDSHELHRGEGYWVFVPADRTWLVDW